ncbi:MAG TPA: hypothetical protein VMD99_16185 [Terriglobales bacterium]|nr:hypothetical protein [Terriglobales bacterium]
MIESHRRRDWKRDRKRSTKRGTRLAVFVVLALIAGSAAAQTNCDEGNGTLNTNPPQNVTVPELIQRFTAKETEVKEARSHYTYTQDVLVQSLNGKQVDGQFHEVTTVSYDEKGKREEKVTYAEQSTLRGLNLTKNDMDDIREIMPLILTTQDAPEYSLTYEGQQHVDDLDTYVFHVVPKKEEKNKRYFQGKIWVDNHDLEVVKVCGKSVPELIHVKRGEHQDLRPTFATYRQWIGGYWFPAFVKVDDTLYFNSGPVHLREIVKFKDYKKVGGTATATAKP